MERHSRKCWPICPARVILIILLICASLLAIVAYCAVWPQYGIFKRFLTLEIREARETTQSCQAGKCTSNINLDASLAGISLQNNVHVTLDPLSISGLRSFPNASKLASALGTKQSYVGIVERADQGPDYPTRDLCSGMVLKRAIQQQDPHLFLESRFNDDGIIENGPNWVVTQPFEDTLSTLVWEKFEKENFPDNEPLRAIFAHWVGSQRGPNFGADFETASDPPNGVLIAINMFRNLRPPEGVPSQASDVIFLQWLRTAKQTNNIANLHWASRIFVAAALTDCLQVGVQGIINSQTIDVLEAACPYSGPTQEWPGCVFDWKTKPRDASAILGTPNGRFVGWMLIGRANELPKKNILNVRAWKGDYFLGKIWNLLFELGELDPSEPIAKRGNGSMPW